MKKHVQREKTLQSWEGFHRSMCLGRLCMYLGSEIAGRSASSFLVLIRGFGLLGHLLKNLTVTQTLFHSVNYGSYSLVHKRTWTVIRKTCTVDATWYSHTVSRMMESLKLLLHISRSLCDVSQLRSRVQKFPAWHTKAAPNGKCCEGYIAPSMVMLMYHLKSVLK